MQIKKRQLWPISPSTPKKASATRSETEHETVAALSEREKALPASVCRPADLHGLGPGPAPGGAALRASAMVAE